MKALKIAMLVAGIAAVALPQIVLAEYVSGHYRKNGTYVQGYNRSSADGNPYNNYSYPGNTNPHTGKVATGDPYTYIQNNGGQRSNTSYGYSTPSYGYPTQTVPNTYTSPYGNNNNAYGE